MSQTSLPVNETEFFDISVEVAKAIDDTADECGKLVKDQRNKADGYNFVSIDQFYEVVAGAARKHGLNWNFTEDKPPVEVGTDVMVTYRVHLWHIDEKGKKITNYPRFRRISVVHPFEGPQTFMSAESYAQKLFMRSLFKVATGEPDADSVSKMQRFRKPTTFSPPANFSRRDQAQARGDQQKAPAAAAPKKTDAERAAEEEIEMASFAKRATDVTVLNDYWKQHQSFLKWAASNDTTRLERLKITFQRRRDALARLAGRQRRGNEPNKDERAAAE